LAKPECRIWQPSLELGAITVYMLNALIYRPGERQAETALVNAACQHVRSDADDSDSEDDDDVTKPILYERGLYFISDLILDRRYYRLPASRPIEPEALAVLYWRPGLKSIQQEFDIIHPAGVETAPNPNRVYSRRTKTLDLRYVRPDEIVAPEFELEVRGVVLEPRARMTGEDIRLSNSDSDQERDQENIDT
jgi:hypothetical protein